MSTPAQKGKQLVQSKAPTFANYLVVDGTWKEKPNTDIETTKDGGGTANLSAGDPGSDAQCDLVLKKGISEGVDADPLNVLDELVETATIGGSTTEGDLRTWIVTEVETTCKNGKPVMQSVKLLYKESLDANL